MYFFYDELGSLPVEGKALIGVNLPPKRKNMEYLSGAIFEINSARGFGIFISLRHFLTVARTLTEYFEENRPVYVSPENLLIVSEKYVHEVLKFETHPNHTSSSFLNNIAVILVSIILKNQ